MRWPRGFTPPGSGLRQSVRSLHARNCHQVLGPDQASPARFVLCWTPDASLDGCGQDVGGTGQALRIAHHYGVPVFNIALAEHAQRLRAIRVIRCPSDPLGRRVRAQTAAAVPFTLGSAAPRRLHHRRRPWSRCSRLRAPASAHRPRLRKSVRRRLSTTGSRGGCPSSSLTRQKSRLHRRAHPAYQDRRRDGSALVLRL